MWEGFLENGSKLIPTPKLAHPLVRSKRGTSRSPPGPAQGQRVPGASSFALVVLAGSAVAGEDAALCPQTRGSFNSIKKGILPQKFAREVRFCWLRFAVLL